MKIVENKIGILELKEMSKKIFGDLVKAVVDIEKEIMAINFELHVDGEEILIQSGSEFKNLWGINIYPEQEDEKFIEFDSMINLKPGLGNRTRGIDNQEIKEKIILIVNKLVEK